MNSNCITPNPFQVSVLTMIDGIIRSVLSTDTDSLSFHNPVMLERYTFIEIASKLHVTFAAACFQDAFDEYLTLKSTLHGTSTSEKIWCYLVCRDTDLKKSIQTMKQLLKKLFTYELMTNYLKWAKINAMDIAIENALNNAVYIPIEEVENMKRYTETL